MLYKKYVIEIVYLTTYIIDVELKNEYSYNGVQLNINNHRMDYNTTKHLDDYGCISNFNINLTC